MQIKTYKDYLDDLQNLYPHIDKKDLEKIMNYQFRQLYLHNSYGGDTLIQDRELWMYIGFLRRDSVSFFNYYVKKLCRKIRILYKRKKMKWDGYYYFVLTINQYEEYLQQKNKKGRPKKYFKLKNIFLYRIYDECRIRQWSHRYIFKIHSPYDLRFIKYYKEVELENPELIEVRNPLKFKDILVINNKYLKNEEQSD